MINCIEACSKPAHLERIFSLAALLETLYPLPVLCREHSIIGRYKCRPLVGS